MLVCHAGCVCVCCIYAPCTQKAKGKEKGERFLRACELPQIGEVCGVWVCVQGWTKWGKDERAYERASGYAERGMENELGVWPRGTLRLCG